MSCWHRSVRRWAIAFLELAALFLAIALAASGQTTQITPDCIINFGIGGGSPFTAAGQATTPTLNGGQNTRYGCFDWRLVYYVDGFSGVSLAVQSAPDSTGAPGSWSTFATSACSSPVTPPCLVDGINPQTATTFGFTGLLGSPPWVRVRLNSVTGSGTVSGVLYGCRQPGCAGSGTLVAGGGGSGGSGCAGSLMTPCVVAGQDNTGTAQIVRTDTNGGVLTGAPPAIAGITLSGSGLTQIIAAGSAVTVVSHISVSLTAAVSFQLEYGTGTNCGTGTTALTGTYANVAAIALDVPFLVPSGKALCINLGSGATGGGMVLYGQP